MGKRLFLILYDLINYLIQRLILAWSESNSSAIRERICFSVIRERIFFGPAGTKLFFGYPGIWIC